MLKIKEISIPTDSQTSQEVVKETFQSQEEPIHDLSFPDNFFTFHDAVKRWTIMVAHIVAVLYTLMIAFYAFPGSSLFSWHPTLMALATTFFVFEAILIFSPQSSLFAEASRLKKIYLHIFCVCSGFLMALFGFCAIYFNKNRNDRPHFVTWHSKIGFASLIFMLGQMSGGTFQVLVPRQKLKALGLTYAKLKLYHATSGLILFLLFCSSLGSGMLSDWFSSTVTGVAMYFCYFCPILMGLIVMQQVSSSYIQRYRK